MSLLNLSPSWSPPNRKHQLTRKVEYQYFEGAEKEQFKVLPFQKENHEPQEISGDGDVLALSAPQELEPFAQEAIVRDPDRGKMVARIRLPANSESKKMMPFQIVKGHFKYAWAKEKLLLVCPLNGPARYVKIMAYPPDECDTGLLLME